MLQWHEYLLIKTYIGVANYTVSSSGFDIGG